MRIVDYNTGDSYEYRDIQSAMSEEELIRRKDNVEQERRTRNYRQALDIIRNRLQNWGFVLMENADEGDRNMIESNDRKLQNQELTEELTDQVYQVFSDISKRLIQ